MVRSRGSDESSDADRELDLAALLLLHHRQAVHSGELLFGAGLRKTPPFDPVYLMDLRFDATRACHPRVSRPCAAAILLPEVSILAFKSLSSLTVLATSSSPLSCTNLVHMGKIPRSRGAE